MDSVEGEPFGWPSTGRRYSKEIWDEKKSLIEELYQKKTLKEAQRILSQDHDFWPR
jgi:hypothetical protein